MSSENQAVGVIGTGLYVPRQVRDNQWFEQFDMLSLDELFDDSGVQERRVCAEGETGADMEAQAVRAAVNNAGLELDDVELILVGPALHDQPMPGNAAMVQYKSGAQNAASINVESACTTLISQMAMAVGLIRGGLYRNVVCVTSANWTKVADLTEKSCMIMGDGAAAVVMGEVAEGRGVLSVHLETDGSKSGAIGCNKRLPRALIRDYQAADYLLRGQEQVYFYVDRNDGGMDEIRSTGPTKTPDAAKKALTKVGLTTADIDFAITHNPTRPLVQAWQEALNVSAEQTHTTLHKFGNMSGASIGANLHEAATLGKLNDNDLVIMCAPGAGYHYAGLVMRWGR